MKAEEKNLLKGLVGFLVATLMTLVIEVYEFTGLKDLCRTTQVRSKKAEDDSQEFDIEDDSINHFVFVH